MKKITRFFVLATLIAGGFSCSLQNGNVNIVDMRCEYASSPIGVDTQQPRFLWSYESEGNRGFTQKAFKLDIASDKQILLNNENGDIWSSDEVNTAISFAEYKGTPVLKSHAKYYWKVSAWDTDNDNIIVSKIDSFETAKMSQDEWQAKWITDKYDKKYGPPPMLRKSFKIEKDIREARAYISAAAYYDLKINGQPAQPHSLEPGYTHYDKRNLYVTIDVTELLQRGENVLGAVLGNGFYNADEPFATWEFEKAPWRDRAKFVMELHVAYTDGTKDIIITDDTWKTATGGSIHNNIYSGEIFDARLEQEGWSNVNFDDSRWAQAIVTTPPSPLLVSQQTEPVKVTQEIAPVSLMSFGDTLHIFDFGVNLAGVCKLNLNGESGTKVKLTHGELLKSNGRVEMGNINIYFETKKEKDMDFQMDGYYMKGEGNETYTPKFTYHGFQYLEVVSDKPLKLKKEDVTALFMHTAVEQVGNFSCSNELLNKIWQATMQSYLGNLHSIPTDCPHREKNGWTGDAHVAIDLALMNFDGIKFYEKWLDDFIDNQRSDGSLAGIIPSGGWGYADWIGPMYDAALFIIPSAIEKYYADTRSIHKLYETCERHLQYLKSRENEDGTVTYGISDWVFYKTKTPAEFTTSCFYYLDNELMAHFAEITGHDPTPYKEKAASLKALINKKHFDQDKAIYVDGSQAGQAVALALGIVPEEYQQRVADELNNMVVANNYSLDFGLLGSKYVPRMLTQYGYVETVYKMATKEEAPSWGYWIKKGYTTLAETWVMSPRFRDASINHIFLGDISTWMTRSLAGINCDESTPGMSHIVIRPHFVEDLTWAKGEYKSVRGMINSEWKRDGNKITLDVVIPENTSATVYTDKKEEVKGGKHQFVFSVK